MTFSLATVVSVFQFQHYISLSHSGSSAESKIIWQIAARRTFIYKTLTFTSVRMLVAVKVSNIVFHYLLNCSIFNICTRCVLFSRAYHISSAFISFKSKFICS